jgi:hypothetical protein
MLVLLYCTFVRETPMIFVTSTNHGCVYTLSQEDGDELYYAPIYSDGSVNLEEFAPVDLDAVDMDDMEIFDIRNRLIKLAEV